jgi:hypothetical protein
MLSHPLQVEDGLWTCGADPQIPFVVRGHLEITQMRHTLKMCKERRSLYFVVDHVNAQSGVNGCSCS